MDLRPIVVYLLMEFIPKIVVAAFVDFGGA